MKKTFRKFQDIQNSQNFSGHFFSRLPSLKRRRRRGRKNWYKLWENLFDNRLLLNGWKVIPCCLWRTHDIIASLARPREPRKDKFHRPDIVPSFPVTATSGPSSSSSSFKTGKTGKKSACAKNHPGLKHLHPYPLNQALFRLPTPSLTFQSGDWVFDWGPDEEFC